MTTKPKDKLPALNEKEMAMFKEQQNYITKEFGDYVGKTISNIRPLTKKETEEYMGWGYGSYSVAFVVMFTDGTCLIPSQDPEGNGAGWLFTGSMEPA